MSLLHLPIPPKPASFHPHGVPPGIRANLTALVGSGSALAAFGAEADDDEESDCCDQAYSDYIEVQEAARESGLIVVDEGEWLKTSAAAAVPWYINRPVIRPRTVVVHTNGASVEASSQSQVNWGNASPSNTKAHYAINQPTPQKLVPTDRRAIANSTGSDIEQQYGVRDSSYWAIAIETADMGANRANAEGRQWPVDCGPFLHDHAELIARILAYECILWDIPPVFQTSFTGTGIVSHTDPFPYPYFTTVRGKTCSGSTKKSQLRSELIPRAAQIVAAWTGTTPPPPPPEDDDMIRLLVQRADNGAIFRSGVAGGYSYVGNLTGELQLAKLCGYKLIELPTGKEVTSASHEFAMRSIEWIDRYMGPNLGQIASIHDHCEEILKDTDALVQRPVGGGGNAPTKFTITGTATAVS